MKKVFLALACIAAMALIGCKEEIREQSPSYMVVDQVVSNGNSRLVRYLIDIQEGPSQGENGSSSFWYYDARGKYNVGDTLVMQVVPIRY